MTTPRVPRLDPQDRLATHVEAIIRASGVPNDERADVREELLGHLEARRRVLLAAGWDDGAATDQAIAEFGDPATISRGFRDAYRGRLWASTVGLALPGAVPASGRPSTVRWLILAMRLAGLFGLAVIADAALELSPVTGLVTAASGVLWSVMLWIAADALDRRARWALMYAMWLLALLMYAGLNQTMSGASISISGWLAFALFVLAIRDWRSITSWANLRLRWRLPGRVLGMGLAAVALVGPLPAASFPDPTQIGPPDVSMVVTASCAEVVRARGEATVWSQTLEIDLAFDRVDVAPRGLDELDASSWHDTVDVIMPAVPGTHVWTGEDLTAGVPWDATADEDRAVSGSPMGLGDPSGPAAEGTMFIGGHRLQAGHRYRLTVTSRFEAPLDEDPWRFVQVAYRHLDRFLLVAQPTACGEPVRAIESPSFA